MENQDWIKAIHEGELKEGVPAVIEVEEKKVLLIRSEERIYACGNECSHYHAPLDEGLIAGHVVTCPWHNARFDIRDGRLVAPPGLNGIPTYETKVEDGQVWIRQVGKGTIPMPEGEDGRTMLIVGAGAAGNSAAIFSMSLASRVAAPASVKHLPASPPASCCNQSLTRTSPGTASTGAAGGAPSGVSGPAAGSTTGSPPGSAGAAASGFSGFVGCSVSVMAVADLDSETG